jgi:hypothetical protein
MDLTTLVGLAKKGDSHVKAIAERELESDREESESELLKGKITAAFDANQSYLELTGFHREFVVHWVELMQQHAVNARKRGPMPKSSLSDALLCYLVYLHIDADHPTLAKTLSVGESQFSGNLVRIRSILNAALREKWPQLAPRPLEDDGRPYYEIGLLVDVTTVEVFRPKGRFGEVKHYFDEHHKVYGLKKEIAVKSARPHVCTSVTPYRPGGIDDYRIHKEDYTVHMDYLQKTADERRETKDDDDHPFWAVLADKKYIGPAADTPNERRFTPMKNPKTDAQKKANKEKSRARVHVECFLGRFFRKFGIFNACYRHDHSHFDLDFDNALMLINEDISASNLTMDDGEFYQKFLDARVERWNSQNESRKRTQEKYKVNKKAKLAKVQRYVQADD